MWSSDLAIHSRGDKLREIISNASSKVLNSTRCKANNGNHVCNKDQIASVSWRAFRISQYDCFLENNLMNRCI